MCVRGVREREVEVERVEGWGGGGREGNIKKGVKYLQHFYLILNYIG